MGLGNLFRFPGLAVKYGLIYIVAYTVILIAAGLPLLYCELALGRKRGGGAVKSFSNLKNGKLVGWLCCADSFIIMTYYCVLFGFVMLAAVFSFRLADSDKAGRVFTDILYPKGFPTLPLLFLVAAWAAVILCFGKAEKLGKISTASVIFATAVIGGLAVFRGISYPQQLLTFCRIDFSCLTLPEFWTDAAGQVFFSLSLMVGVMPAYGSFLDKKENIVLCGGIIALFDLIISVFATFIYATAVTDGSEGLLACFSVYPEVFASLGGVLGSIVSFLFYLSLALLCLDSVFAYLKSITGCLRYRFSATEDFFVVITVAVSALLGVFLLGSAGKPLVDFADSVLAPRLTLLAGFLEAVIFARLALGKELIGEINLGCKRGISPKLFEFSCKVICPVMLMLLILCEMFT